MKKMLLVLPIFAGTMSGCNMASMIDESTYAIHTNRQAIETSTETINRNIEAVEMSNRTLDENKRKLDELTKSQ